MGDCLLDILCIFIIIFLVWIANVRKENKEIIVSKRLSLTIRKNNIIIYLDNYPYKVEGENISLRDRENTVSFFLYFWRKFAYGHSQCGYRHVRSVW